MALLTAGFWPTTFFLNNYWHDNYWQNYGLPSYAKIREAYTVVARITDFVAVERVKDFITS